MENETKDLALNVVLDGIKAIKEGQKDMAVKADVTAIETTLKADIKVVADEQDKLKTQLDALDKKGSKLILAGNENKSFNQIIKETIAENAAAIQSIKKGDKISLDLKAVGDMSYAVNFPTADSYVTDVRAGIIQQPARKVHVRSLLAGGTTNTKTFTYVRESGGEGSPDWWMSGTKPQMDFDLEEVDAPVRDIAAYLQIPQNMLDDIEGLTSFLQVRMLEKYLQAEDDKVLYGASNTAPYFQGLTVAATGTASGSTRIIDKLVLSAASIEGANYQATGILMHPRNYAELVLNQTTARDYSYPVVFNASTGGLTIAGIPVFKSTAINQGYFLMGDWSMGAQLLTRMAPKLEFFYEHGTNVTTNQVTVRVEGRAALPIYHTGAWVYSTVGLFS
jgi:HK97 family phage major capsid protein